MQQKLEQFLKCKIEISYNKNLIIKCIHKDIKTYYDYEFEECDKPLKVLCGIGHDGKYYLDIEQCPHILVGGETGGGKTSLYDTIILSLLRSKYDIDLHLIDFQNVGLGKYQNCKKVKSYGSRVSAFEELMGSMENENKARLAKFASVSDKVYIDKLSVWNKLYPKRRMPYKVVIIDEFMRLADKQNEIMLSKFRDRVSEDRKVGLHYIASATRPDVTVIQGSIKGNLTCRIAFKTLSETDSRVVLDLPGAEKLQNKGRFLIKHNGDFKEVQGLYLPSENIRKYLIDNDLFKSAEVLSEERRKRDQFKSKDECLNPFVGVNTLPIVQGTIVEMTQAAYRKAKIEAFHKFVPDPYKKEAKK